MGNVSSRRSFLGTAGATAALGAAFIEHGCTGAAPSKPYWEPKLTDNLYRLDESRMRWLAQLGCKHVSLQDDGQGVDWDNKNYWTVGDIGIAQQTCAEFGLKLASMLIPMKWYRRNCAGETGRDEEIDYICRSIDAAGAAGIPVLEWRPTWLDFYWDERVGYAWIPGRGGSRYWSFDKERIKDKPDFTEFEPVTRDEMWERFLYLGRPIVDAAEKAGIKLSCHPNDPPIPIMRGMPRVMVTMNDVRRFLEEIPSPANGITFCQGTFTEMGEDVIACIRELGSRIHHVHLRAVRGTIPMYSETFIDEGDIDMVEAMKAYRDIDYRGTMVADHSPDVEGDGIVGRTFSLGYIRAMIQAVNALS